MLEEKVRCEPHKNTKCFKQKKIQRRNKRSFTIVKKSKTTTNQSYIVKLIVKEFYFYV